MDGRLLTQSVSQAFAAGQIAPVPLIIGSNSYEASLMASLKLPAAMVLAVAPAALKAAYADQPTDQAKAAALFTDAFMGAPAHWIAGKAQAGPSFLYHFAYVLDMRRATAPGAGHDSEIPFVFDSWDHLGALGAGLKLSDRDHAGTITHDAAVAKVQPEFEKIRVGEDANPRPVDVDFESAMEHAKRIAAAKTKRKPKRGAE